MLDGLTLHDVVTVSDETEANGEGDDSNLPGVDIGVLLDRLASGPGTVHSSPDTDSVTNIVGTVSERGSAGSDDLDERVQVLDLVGVLGSVAVDTVHAATLRSVVDTDLSGVDVVVETVHEGDNDVGRKTLEVGNHVVLLVDGTSTDGVLVEGAHSPADGTSLLAEGSVVTVESLSHQNLVIGLSTLGNRERLLAVGKVGVGGGRGDFLVTRVVGALLGVVNLGPLNTSNGVSVIAVLDNGVVGNAGGLGIGGSRALEQEGSVDELPGLEGVVLLDDLGVDEGNKEQAGEDEQTPTDTHGDGSNVPGGLLVKLKLGGTLVDDGQGADGTGDQEEEGRGPDSPGNGVGAQVDNELDEQEDDSGETTRDGGSHSQTGEDGTETLALVPSPLNTVGTDGSDTDTSDGGDQGVGGRDVGRVTSAPHDPRSSTGGGTGEGEQLDTGVVAEGSERNDTVLDGGGGTGTDSQSAGHLKDQAEDHGPSVGDGPGGDTGSPGVGDIVCGEG